MIDNEKRLQFFIGVCETAHSEYNVSLIWLHRAILWFLHSVSSPGLKGTCGWFTGCQEDSCVTYIMHLNNPAHGKKALCDSSLHGFGPETWPLTLTWDINWAADILCFRHLISFWKTCTATPHRAQVIEKKPWWYYLKTLLLFLKEVVSDHSAGVSLMDGWVMKNWSHCCPPGGETLRLNLKLLLRRGKVSVFKLAHIQTRSVQIEFIQRDKIILPCCSHVLSVIWFISVWFWQSFRDVYWFSMWSSLSKRNNIFVTVQFKDWPLHVCCPLSVTHSTVSCALCKKSFYIIIDHA